jgi:hypothetical protein
VQAESVITENERPGTTNWEITGPQTATGMMGYADQVQVTQGQKFNLYVSTEAAQFHVEAYRMGYYQGSGARLVWQSPDLAGQVQPVCPAAEVTHMVECDWSQPLNVSVTSDWVPGEYLLKLVGSGGQESYVPLTVWDPASHATYVIMDGVFTTQVFNPFGGYDLYQGATACARDVYPCSSRALVVSFDRPYDNSYGQGAGTYLSLVYPLTRLAEQDGLDVTYWTDFNLDSNGSLLTNHKVLISTGHDEEWTLNMRNATLTAAGRGVNLIFFGASAILRKVRLQESPLGADREIVNYRDPSEDPLYGIDDADVSQNEWVQRPASWDPTLLLGADYVGYNNDVAAPLVDSNSTSWLFAGTGLQQGQSVPGVLSGDFQEYLPSDPNPAGVEILSHSPIEPQPLSDHHYADTTYYTMTPSEAGVFQSGTTAWIPSLAPCPATLMDQITDNLLRVFGQGPVGATNPSQANWQLYYY